MRLKDLIGAVELLLLFETEVIKCTYFMVISRFAFWPLAISYLSNHCCQGRRLAFPIHFGLVIFGVL